MKLKSKINLIVDVLMFLFLLPVFFGRGHLHEVFGWIVAVLFVIHIVLHWLEIKCLVQAWFQKKTVRWIVIVLFCIVSIGTIVFSMQKTKELRLQRQNRFHGNLPYQQQEQNNDSLTEP